MGSTVIMAFGDSITYGAEDPNGGWVHKLSKFLEERSTYDFYYTVFNLGVGSDTTDDLLERFDSEMAARLKLRRDSIIILFQIGTNDSVKIGSESNPCRVELGKFSDNISELISKARKHTKDIIFIGPLPVDESKTNPKRWEDDYYLKNERIASYNKAVKQKCKENEVEFVDLFSKFSKMKKGYIQLLDNDDGVHPNMKGHNKIFSFVKTELIKTNWIKV